MENGKTTAKTVVKNLRNPFLNSHMKNDMSKFQSYRYNIMSYQILYCSFPQVYKI